MRAAAPDILVRRGLDWGLVWTIAVSALVHAGAVALLIAMPLHFLGSPQPLQSYTVDLVAPNVLGGTNLVAGGGARPRAPGRPPMAAAAPAPFVRPAVPEPRAATEPAAEPVKPPSGGAAAERPDAAKPPAVEPQFPEPKPAPPEPKLAPLQANPVEAKPPPAKVEAPTKSDAVVLKPKLREKPARPKAPAQKPAAPAMPPAAVSESQGPKAEPKPEPKPKPKPEPRPKPEPKPEPKPAPVAKAALPAKPAPPAGVGEASLDKRIAAAVQKRAAQVRRGDHLDDKIAAAVQRRAAQAGTGSAPSGPGGPVSVGPGAGAGGTPMDLEFILYQGRMEERIKAAWAWAGARRNLQAVIQFSLSRAGEISNVRTVQSSGDAQYDASCERAVRAASPLDPVPEKYRSAFSTGVEMTFKPDEVES